MSIRQKVAAALCAAALLICPLSLGVVADDANVTYTGNSGDLIFAPGSEHSPTDLFANFKNVVPGASLTQKITVSNRADNKATVKIYLRSLGSADEKYNAFLNQLTLTVTEETGSPLFEAAADKTAGLTDWVCLGTLYSGASLDLNVTLDVPTTLDNMFQKQIGKIRWQFVAEEFPIEEPEWKCPDGEKHTYHIEERNGISVFVCDDCGQSEDMKCETCGGKMREVIVVMIGGKTYTAYAEGEGNYKTPDGKVKFHLNGEGILEYYIVGDKRIDVKSVSEYTLYRYYECLDNPKHHTDPSPHTGDDSSAAILWTALPLAGVSLLIILLLRRRKKDDKEVRATW